MNRFQIAIKAATQLGLHKTVLYARYQFGLKSGILKFLTPSGQLSPKAAWLKPSTAFPLAIPDIETLTQTQGKTAAWLFEEANTILGGQFHRFGAEQPSPIDLAPQPPLAHWTQTNDDPGSGEDIKFIWEAARFGWVFTLGRAYVLQQDDKYAAAFWKQAETFWAANPPNMGPNWASGQEVALRILAFTFALHVFDGAESTTSARRHRLLASIIEHAQRIPPTILYARAQNNNHLITEAVGLYTAGCLLPDHPQADRWRRLGWRWFNWACLHQIESNGTYIQHSTNYHRLMLQAALWFNAMSRIAGNPLPVHVQQRLAAATQWLHAYSDKTSGHVPNLGHNDGAHILPLAYGAFKDYRPTLQAAACAFLRGPVLPAGPWDEAALWFGLDPAPAKPFPASSSVHVLRLDDLNRDSWAALRAVQYQDRPAQADQLHVEVWWQGINIACDPGTYRYTALPPWDNGLARTGVHNTVMVDNQEQMVRAGRFLWLDWAQAFVRPQNASTQSITAQHNGYHRLGINHQRTLACIPAGGWLITDTLMEIKTAASLSPHEITLHWLLPDLPWKYENGQFIFQTKAGQAVLRVTADTDENPLFPSLQIIRAGKVIYGAPADLPTHGWFSPTYAVKLPALSILASLNTSLPVKLHSIWQFSPVEHGT